MQFSFLILKNPGLLHIFQPEEKFNNTILPVELFHSCFQTDLATNSTQYTTMLPVTANQCVATVLLAHLVDSPLQALTASPTAHMGTVQIC